MATLRIDTAGSLCFLILNIFLNFKSENSFISFLNWLHPLETDAPTAQHLQQLIAEHKNSAIPFRGSWWLRVRVLEKVWVLRPQDSGYSTLNPGFISMETNCFDWGALWWLCQNQLQLTAAYKVRLKSVVVNAIGFKWIRMDLSE